MRGLVLGLAMLVGVSTLASGQGVPEQFRSGQEMSAGAMNRNLEFLDAALARVRDAVAETRRVQTALGDSLAGFSPASEGGPLQAGDDPWRARAGAVARAAELNGYFASVGRDLGSIDELARLLLEGAEANHDALVAMETEYGIPTEPEFTTQLTVIDDYDLRVFTAGQVIDPAAIHANFAMLLSLIGSNGANSQLLTDVTERQLARFAAVQERRLAPCTEPEEVILIPDANLRGIIAEELGAAGGPILCSGMRTLSTLHLFARDIRSIEGLQHAVNLTELNLATNEVSDISVLANLTGLTRLVLEDNSISDISVLANLTNLTRLVMGDNEIGDISALAHLTKLVGLDLDGNQVGSISVLAQLTGLTSLDFGRNTVSDISVLANLTRLTELGMGGNAIGDISPLGVLADLTVLNLSDNVISDISPLANLTELQRLDLGGNALTDVAPLANFTNLYELDLADNEIGDGIAALKELPRLLWLYLSGNAISDISVLADFGTLNIVDLSANAISDITALEHLSDLTWVDLNDNCLDASAGTRTLEIVRNLERRATDVDIEDQRDCDTEPLPTAGSLGRVVAGLP